ncbi:MAG: 3-deoxy-7-phosphoheptulonate synthase [Pseudomonadota bacterium]
MSELLNDFCIAQPPLIKPRELLQAMPCSVGSTSFIKAARAATTNIIQGRDQRLLVIVGPCSIHDENITLEYAELLSNAALQFADELLIVMRVYFEKPRTLLGWKGLISDPWLDESFDINHGLQLARKILLQLAKRGVPAATEFLDNIIPQYLQDLITWSAIGARTAESQLHRELASGLAMPVGFKNTTAGNVQVAVDAVNAARHSHCFLGISTTGEVAVTRTPGNNAGHIVLRGSHDAVNYTNVDIKKAVNALADAGLTQRLMVDCSHGNSMRDFQQQPKVISALVEQLQEGATSILGVMLESNLVAGKQQVNANKPLVYGQSITDACLSWRETLPLLEQLALGVKHRGSG